MTTQASTFRALLEKEEVMLYENMAAQVRRVNAAQEAVKVHSELMNQLAHDLVDSDVDKESVFHRMQEAGIELTGEGLVSPKAEQLKQELLDLSKIQSGAEFAMLSQKLNEFSARSATMDQDIAEFASIIGAKGFAGDLETLDSGKPAGSLSAQKLAQRIRATDEKTSL